MPTNNSWNSQNPAQVAMGGTGDSSVTAYAPLCGGTTSTAAFQSAATNFGTNGYVLTSNGSSALPSWQLNTSLLGITESTTPFLTALGSGATTTATGTYNTAIGYHAANALTTGANNVSVGGFSLNIITTGDNNTAVGAYALSQLTTSSDNTAIGTSALGNQTTGVQNTAVGSESLSSLVAGSHNAALGYNTLATNDGSDNVAVGFAALTTVSNDFNTAVGSLALTQVDSGTRNTALGYNAGSVYDTGESNNICIGANVVGVLGESTTTRVGLQSTQTACYIAGINGVTPSTSALIATCDSTGKLATVASGTSGQVLTSNGSGVAPTWQVAPAGAYYSMTPYIVGSDVHSQYSTIQAAITAAAAAGASVASPFNVYIKPGTYNETLTASAGVNLIGLGSDSEVGYNAETNQPVKLTGTITIGLNVRMTFQNIHFNYSGAGAAITLSGTPISPQFAGSAVFSGCQFDGTGVLIRVTGYTNAISLDSCNSKTINTFIDIPGISPTVNILNSYINGLITQSDTTGGANFNIRDCSLDGNFVFAGGFAIFATNSSFSTSDVLVNAAASTVGVGANILSFTDCDFETNTDLFYIKYLIACSMSGCSGTVGGAFVVETVGGTSNTYNLTNSFISEQSGPSHLNTGSMINAVESGGLMPTSGIAGTGLVYFGSIGSDTSYSTKDLVSNSVPVSTTDTNGFFHVPATTGTPTGTPTLFGASIPVLYDTSKDQLWAYNQTTPAWVGIAGYRYVGTFSPSSGSIIITLPTTGQSLLFVLRNLIPNTNVGVWDLIYMQVSTDGVNYITTGYTSGINALPYNSITMTNTTSTTNLLLGNTHISGQGYGLSGQIYSQVGYGGGTASALMISGTTTCGDIPGGTTWIQNLVNGIYPAAAAVVKVKFTSANGLLTFGSVELYRSVT